VCVEYIIKFSDRLNTRRDDVLFLHPCLNIECRALEFKKRIAECGLDSGLGRVESGEWRAESGGVGEWRVGVE
jgi:hypothetical protein